MANFLNFGAAGAAILTAFTWLSAGCDFAGGDGDGDGDDMNCPVGSRGCPCTSGGSCDATLSCADGFCLLLSAGGAGGSTSTGGANSAAGTGGSGGQNTAGSGGQGMGGTSSVDPCQEAGGTLTAEGACYKECTYDYESPGQDLFEDCTALRMVCDGRSYCVPGGVCNTDADCGAGRRCISFGGGECILDCAEAGTCPSVDFACISTCPGNGENIDNLPGCLDISQQSLCAG